MLYGVITDHRVIPDQMLSFFYHTVSNMSLQNTQCQVVSFLSHSVKCAIPDHSVEIMCHTVLNGVILITQCQICDSRTHSVKWCHFLSHSLKCVIHHDMPLISCITQYYIWSHRITCVIRSDHTGSHVSFDLITQDHMCHSIWSHRITCVIRSDHTGSHVSFDLITQDHMCHSIWSHRITCVNHHHIFDLIWSHRISELDDGITLTQPRLVAGITVTGVNTAPSRQPQMAKKRGRRKHWDFPLPFLYYSITVISYLSLIKQKIILRHECFQVLTAWLSSSSKTCILIVYVYN